MAEVHFTRWLREWAPPGPVNVSGKTVGEALASLFEQQPQLQSYVVDERGALRKHVCIFADGQRLARDATMGHAVAPDSKLCVMQALSGG
jgi:molybdopterin synthase sulfur carrier subunit